MQWWFWPILSGVGTLVWFSWMFYTAPESPPPTPKDPPDMG